MAKNKVKIFFDPILNSMNIWWGSPSDASSSQEVESPYRNDVIVLDKSGTPISLEIIGILPQELNIASELQKYLPKGKSKEIDVKLLSN